MHTICPRTVSLSRTRRAVTYGIPNNTKAPAPKKPDRKDRGWATGTVNLALGRKKAPDHTITRSGPHTAVPLSQLRSGAAQDATNDDQPDLLSFSPTQEEDDQPVRQILTPALQVEEPTANQRLFDEVTALSQELIMGPRHWAVDVPPQLPQRPAVHIRFEEDTLGKTRFVDWKNIEAKYRPDRMRQRSSRIRMSNFHSRNFGATPIGSRSNCSIRSKTRMSKSLSQS